MWVMTSSIGDKGGEYYHQKNEKSHGDATKSFSEELGAVSFLWTMACCC